MKILYYDCFSGISGDMNLGAMLDLGVDQEYLINQLKRLKLRPDYEIEILREKRAGISGTRVKIKELSKRDHDNNNFETNNYRLIKKQITESELSQEVKTRSLKAFELLAEAEGKIHGCAKEEVHFHEIGALDSIIDIVGSAICLDYLKVDRVLASTVELGGGFVRCQHGLLPVPVPAVVELLKGVPVKIGGVEFETTTPTGAAILAANVDEFTDKREFIIDKVGYGAGERDLDKPNLLRIYLGKLLGGEAQLVDTVNQYMVETNLDDMNPELFEIVEEKLFQAGALDVFKTPIIMKKSRPAVKLSVLTERQHLSEIERVIFLETTAIGLRNYQVQKKMLSRKTTVIDTIFGQIEVKYTFFQGRIIKGKPEYESCKKLALAHNLSISEIYHEANLEISKFIERVQIKQ